MPQVIVGKWGKSLAVRVPVDVAAAAGLVDGEAVEIEAVDGAVVIRRDAAKAAAREKAEAAMAEIIELSKGVTLGGLSIRDMINEGRR
ncbi:AbrB/MazE/SpoVT family DNA-binding domain-containing protein [Novosphingobium sp.]|uniref:AbrB/MazE/SpoVT family DNA-binding domain-containing protein n=1 Tax=Novosphingobium sp. TaxID=1874826 RepID=UPI00261266BD|nr:AbrB/MazE/SpoVT family DNA-binding domain-containing protein [Novosphingobium sp.]